MRSLLSTSRRRLFLLAIVLCVLASCTHRSPGTSVSKGRDFTDGIGRKVSVIVPPQRLISLAPNLTEILFALGLDDRISGVTSYCDFPEAAKSKEKVGDTLRPNLERIIALKPDLVLITTSSQLESITREFDRLSIPVFVTNPRNVRDIPSSIRILGEVTGTVTRANEIADEMERRI